MNFLQDSIRTLKGIGPKRAELYHRLGIFTLYELLNYYPREYRDFSKVNLCGDVWAGQDVLLRLTICSDPVTNRFSRRSMVRVQAQDSSGQIPIVWFNQPYIRARLHPGMNAYFMGRVQTVRNTPALVNPTMEQGGAAPGILPVYSLTQGLSMRHMRSAVSSLLDMCTGQLKETLPDYVRKQFNLCGYPEAVYNIHFPKDMQALHDAKQRAIFEDLYYFFTMLEDIRLRRGHAPADPLPVTKAQTEEFLSALPFKLTGHQCEALDAIAHDTARPYSMNRMLQGDVGSGKTVPAMFLLYAAFLRGVQGAFMAPTEILAQQHYQTLKRFFEPLGCRVGLLTSGMSTAERSMTRVRISDGSLPIVVGTQALIQQTIEFHSLGAVVVDEQHRFGVAQRARFTEKGHNPHVLIMSATPIPRTLSLILYGDLDVSVIRELPPGRKLIDTHHVPKERYADMLVFIKRQLQAGRQTYIVCPMIDDDPEAGDVRSVETVYSQMREVFKDWRVTALHGKMPRDEKESVMAAFARGEIHVLVCTTVVEVGVDVPNATVMVIEDAQRFGMAQLHQLRGRVGRSYHASYCFLLGDAENETAQERLRTLCKTQDGFTIAEQDLKLRGPGEFLGKRQHGDGVFYSAALMADMNFMQSVQAWVKQVAAEPQHAAEWQRACTYAYDKYKNQLREIVLN